VKTSSLLTFTAIACLVLSSCVPGSQCPLSLPKDAHVDSSLIGDWLNKEDQETYRITAKDSSWMHVDVLKAGAKTDSYDFFSTTVGKNTFANVVLNNKDNPALPPTAFTFIRYSTSTTGTLKMWSLSSKASAAAVHSGKLKGSVSADKNEDVYLTDDSDVLFKFLQKADLDKLFTNEITLTKVESQNK